MTVDLEPVNDEWEAESERAGEVAHSCGGLKVDFDIASGRSDANDVPGAAAHDTNSSTVHVTPGSFTAPAVSPMGSACRRSTISAAPAPDTRAAPTGIASFAMLTFDRTRSLICTSANCVIGAVSLMSARLNRSRVGSDVGLVTPTLVSISRPSRCDHTCPPSTNRMVVSSYPNQTSGEMRARQHGTVSTPARLSPARSTTSSNCSTHRRRTAATTCS